MQTTWELTLPNWKEANIRSLEAIHTKANEAFKHTLDINERIASRAFTFISILVPIISLIIGLLGRELMIQDDKIPSVVLVSILIVCLPASLSLGALIWMVFPKKLMHPGREPKNLAIAEYIQHELYDNDQQYIALLINEIEDLQRKILFNQQKNNHRLALLKKIIIIISISLFIALIILATSVLFTSF